MARKVTTKKKQASTAGTKKKKAATAKASTSKKATPKKTVKKKAPAKKKATKKAEKKVEKKAEKAPKKKRATRKKVVAEVRLKAYWGVFNQSLKRVALYEYNQRRQADKRAEELMGKNSSPHFVQLVKEVIEPE